MEGENKIRFYFFFIAGTTATRMKMKPTTAIKTTTAVAALYSNARNSPPTKIRRPIRKSGYRKLGGIIFLAGIMLGSLSVESENGVIDG
jgi:hypothetical protein